MMRKFFPSSLRRGGCAIKKTSQSIHSRADGVVILSHHPVRFADTPPRGGE
jgi:hypothetical protein